VAGRRVGQGLSAHVVVRLKETGSQEYNQWMRRGHSSPHYGCHWADWICANVCREDDVNKKQCLLVLMGTTTDPEDQIPQLSLTSGICEQQQHKRGSA
jgi:hypothetical protein